MGKNLREAKEYFDTAMSYIDKKSKMEHVPSLLFLGEMSLDTIEEAKKSGITPLVITGMGQEMINFVSVNNYTISGVENGKGIAYFDPSTDVHFDFVTDGTSISPVYGFNFTKEDGLVLTTGDEERQSLIILNDESKSLIATRVSSKSKVKSKVTVA